MLRVKYIFTDKEELNYFVYDRLPNNLIMIVNNYFNSGQHDRSAQI